MDNNYYYDNQNPAAALFIFGIYFMIFAVAYVVSALLLSSLFKKVGIESWKAWVPVYNSWMFNEAGGVKGWLSLLVFLNFIPFVGWIGAIFSVVFTCIAAYRIGLGFRKDGAWVVLYIFLPLIWLILMAVENTPFDRRLTRVSPVPNFYNSNTLDTANYYSNPQSHG